MSEEEKKKEEKKQLKSVPDLFSGIRLALFETSKIQKTMMESSALQRMMIDSAVISSIFAQSTKGLCLNVLWNAFATH